MWGAAYRVRICFNMKIIYDNWRKKHGCFVENASRLIKAVVFSEPR